MQTLQTQPSSLPSAWQAEVLVDDINASIKPRKPMTIATTRGLESNQKAQLLNDKLNQIHTSDTLPFGPQLAKPTVSTGVDETFKLLTDVKEIKDLNEFDYDLFQDALEEAFIQILQPMGLTRVGVAVEAVNKFSNYLDEIKESNPSDFNQLQKLGGLAKAFRAEPSESNYAVLLAEVIVVMIGMRVLTQQSQAEVIGLYIGLAFSNTEFQAEKIIDQGFMAMVGAAVQAASTIGMSWAGYSVQKEGFAKKDTAFVRQTELKGIKATINKLDEKKLPDSIYEHKQYKGVTDEKMKESELSAGKTREELKAAQNELDLKTDSGEIADRKKVDRLEEELRLKEKEILHEKNSKDSIIIQANDWTTKSDASHMSALNPNKLAIDSYKKDVERLKKAIHVIGREADERQAMGSAIVYSTGITQLGSAAMSSVTKAAEAGATIDATNASNYEKVIQMMLQYLQSMLSAQDGLISLLTEILRSKNEAMGVMANNTKMGG